MQSTVDVQVDESSDTVSIKNLEVNDSDIVDFLSDRDAEAQQELVTWGFKSGMKTLEMMETSQELEYVERRLTELESDLRDEVEDFHDKLEEKVGSDGEMEQLLQQYLEKRLKELQENLQDDVTDFQEELDNIVGNDGELKQILENHLGEDGELETRIEKAFGEDGVFVERLDEELGEDGERIQNALDPDKEGTPTYRLEQRISNEIKSLRDAVTEDEAKEEIRSETYLKGGDFEDSVQNILNETVRQTTSEVHYTGDKNGELDRDVGDFVVQLGETQQNIVVEAKTEYHSAKDISEEMQDAIRNRNADYGIFVTDELGNIPATKLGWFHELRDQKIVIVALSDGKADEMEPGYLRIAFNWARMRAIQSYAEIGDDFEPGTIQNDIGEIEEAIGRFKTIRGHCTEMKKSREKIEEELDGIEREISKRISNVLSELQKAAAA